MAQQANQPLPNGHQLEEYTIDRQLSLGGFSIVYLATDPEGRQVAIKEYLPNSLALRARGEIKPVITSDHLGAFHQVCNNQVKHRISLRLELAILYCISHLLTDCRR